MHTHNAAMASSFRSSTPDWYNLLMDIAHKQWFILNPFIPAELQILATGLLSSGSSEKQENGMGERDGWRNLEDRVPCRV